MLSQQLLSLFCNYFVLAKDSDHFQETLGGEKNRFPATTIRSDSARFWGFSAILWRLLVLSLEVVWSTQYVESFTSRSTIGNHLDTLASIKWSQPETETTITITTITTITTTTAESQREAESRASERCSRIESPHQIQRRFPFGSHRVDHDGNGVLEPLEVSTSFCDSPQVLR